MQHRQTFHCINPSPTRSFLPSIVSMKLPDNVKHGAMFVGTDGASSADPLAHCPQPARGEVGKAHSPRVISVKPDYGSPACPPVSFNRALNSPQVIVDETGRLRA